MRERLRADSPSLALALATDIPFPGLAEPHSQLAVPIVAAGQVLGALFAESPTDRENRVGRFRLCAGRRAELVDVEC